MLALFDAYFSHYLGLLKTDQPSCPWDILLKTKYVLTGKEHMDKHTREQRSKNMKAIRSKDTGIELALRGELFRRGYRYRVNYKKATGRPDIAFPKQKVAVFADSEFWHGYEWEKNQKNILSNRQYWIPKIERNIARDRKINEQLESEGWIVIRLWGKEIELDLDACVRRIEAALAERR